MTYDRFEDLPVWLASIELADRVYELSESAAFAGHSSLRDQIERAALSVSNNIAEGFERGTNQELITFLYYARGSAGEVRSMLALMERRAAFSDFKVEIASLKSLAENIARQLRAWAGALQNSDIKGQRFLTERSQQSARAVRRGKAFEQHLRQVVEENRQARHGNTTDPVDQEPDEST